MRVLWQLVEALGNSNNKQAGSAPLKSKQTDTKSNDGMT